MRYYFHVWHQNYQVNDVEGAEFATLQEAEIEAKAALQDLMAEALRSLQEWTISGIKICTDNGDVAFVSTEEALPTGLRLSTR